MKKAFLTGGSSGIGQTFNSYMTSQGFYVSAPARTELDLSNFDSLTLQLAEYDYLILCAGVDTNGRQPFINLNESDFINTINVNLVANMKIIHRYLQQRDKNNWSKIIILGSNIVDFVWPNFSAYGTSKVALDSFVDSLIRELAGTQIGLTVIHPGLTKTNFHFNRGNVAEEQKNILYDTLPHMTPDELVPVFSAILTDKKHLIKKITISA